MKKSLRERKARPLHFNVINSHCAMRLSQKLSFFAHYNFSVITASDLCVKEFFFSFVCWLLNFLWFIKGTNKTDSSLHSMKSVSLILLFYFFISIVSCTKQQWALLNNAWRMMNYGQEWHIKKNGLFACLYTFIVDRYLSRNTIYMTQASMVVYYKVKLGEPRSRENVWHFLSLIWHNMILTEEHIMAESRWYSIHIK